jgi:hypothetical protein
MRRYLVLGIALLLAACGSSSRHRSASVPVLPPTPATTATTAPPAPSATVTTVATGPTSTTATAEPCVAADLKLSFIGGQGATGHGLLGFKLRNTSLSSCSTFGYPGVLFLSSSGQPLPTSPIHTTHDYFGTTRRVLLTVAPGSSVSFRLGVTHGTTSTAGCATAYGLQVIVPNDTATLRAEIGNGGAYECRSVTVSPVQPGTSAYP